MFSSQIKTNRNLSYIKYKYIHIYTYIYIYPQEPHSKTLNPMEISSFSQAASATDSFGFSSAKVPGDPIVPLGGRCEGGAGCVVTKAPPAWPKWIGWFQISKMSWSYIYIYHIYIYLIQSIYTYDIICIYEMFSRIQVYIYIMYI